MTDVARAADVSVATVSRAFNIPAIVRDDVRERVMAAASSLGYSPNPAAKALRLQRTNIFGAAIPTLDYGIFARMVNSFQERLSQSGHSVLVATTGFDNRSLLDTIRGLVECGAQAVLTTGRVEDDALREFLRETRTPVVTTYSYQERDQIPSIGFDNYAATGVVVDYLLRLGHRNIVMVAARTKGNDRQEARVRCFRDMMAAAGLAKCAHVMGKDYAFVLADGIDAMRRIHRELPATTAVVCNSDVFAFGVLAECRKLGIRVPEDLSVTGFDDFDFAALTDPPLTTVAVPAKEMGIKAAEALLDAAYYQIAPPRGRPDCSVVDGSPKSNQDSRASRDSYGGGRVASFSSWSGRTQLGALYVRIH